jgi:hypothetical protein
MRAIRPRISFDRAQEAIMFASRAIFAATLALVWSIGAWAAESKAGEYNGIRYLSGAAASSEVDTIRQATQDYSLGLTFTTHSGEYLAGVNVTLKNEAGEAVLVIVSEGPVLLVDLPVGRYALEAAFEGVTVKRDIAIAAGEHRQVVVQWPLTDPPRAAADPLPNLQR